MSDYYADFPSMRVRELIELLKNFDPDATVFIRDLNGSNWFAEPKNFRETDFKELTIDSENINLID